MKRLTKVTMKHVVVDFELSLYPLECGHVQHAVDVRVPRLLGRGRAGVDVHRQNAGGNDADEAGGLLRTADDVFLT